MRFPPLSPSPPLHGRPTVEVSLPRPGLNAVVDRIRIGLSDANSGVDFGTLSIKASFPVASRPALVELADLTFSSQDGVYEIAFGQPLGSLTDAHVLVEVKDSQGNVTRVDREFSVASGNACDLNSDGGINVLDVQSSVNQALGATACTTGDMDGDGSCGVIDVQRVINAALGGACRIG